ncbi:MAG TPA: lipid-A-disaccharide synthase [Acidobacteriaceae bacterium]
MSSNPRIFLSAGEASGDHYGAAIIAGLRARLPEATFTGLGGTGMEAAGQQRVVRAEDVAHMGLTEVIRHAPYIHSQYRRLVAAIKGERPDLAILIDFPDVNFRLAKHLRRLGVPVLWFVSPQLWAWKRRRLRWVQQRVDRMLVIFPFEEAFYRARGVNAQFVGHPLAKMAMPEVSREEYAARHGLDPARSWIALLPGSRSKEVRLNLPAMIEMAARSAAWAEYTLPVASTIDRQALQSEIDVQLHMWFAMGPTDLPKVVLVDDAREALFHARASVVASGTATVQALTIGNPFVVVYRVSKLTFAVAKRMIRYPAEIRAERDADGNLPVGMVNLIAGRRIVPELLNERFTAENLAAALRPLLEDGPARSRMVSDLAEARERLLPGVRSDPIARVCDAAEELLRAGRRAAYGTLGGNV